MSMSKVVYQILKNIQKQLIEKGNKSIIEQQSNYFKHVLPFRGFKSPELKNLFKELYVNEIKELNESDIYDLSIALLKQDYFEDKELGIMSLQKIVVNLEKQQMDNILKIIQNGYVQNWGTCDSLAGKVIKNWTRLSQENTEYICNWRYQQDYLWARRCMCVSFVTRARHGDSQDQNFKGFSDLMFIICQEVIQYDERFNQLGCGWLLRELSLADKKRTIQFIQTNYDKFSREGLRYAIEKMSNQEKNSLLKFKPSSQKCLEEEDEISKEKVFNKEEIKSNTTRHTTMSLKCSYFNQYFKLEDKLNSYRLANFQTEQGDYNLFKVTLPQNEINYKGQIIIEGTINIRYTLSTENQEKDDSGPQYVGLQTQGNNVI